MSECFFFASSKKKTLNWQCLFFVSLKMKTFGFVYIRIYQFIVTYIHIASTNKPFKMNRFTCVACIMRHRTTIWHQIYIYICSVYINKSNANGKWTCFTPDSMAFCKFFFYLNCNIFQCIQSYQNQGRYDIDNRTHIQVAVEWNRNSDDWSGRALNL